MIINHPKKIIFIKPKKVGGTSFEIALSKHCGGSCVVTPLLAQDEEIRRKLGGRGARNFMSDVCDRPGISPLVTFHNHSSAFNVRHSVDSRIWQDYKKVTITRSPFDVAISKYFWRGGEKTGLNFYEWVLAVEGELGENSVIAPAVGSCALDCYLRYDFLREDILSNGLDFLLSDFERLRCKGYTRPEKGSSVQEMYSRYPQAIEVVARACAEEISRHRYSAPII